MRSLRTSQVRLHAGFSTDAGEKGLRSAGPAEVQLLLAPFQPEFIRHREEEGRVRSERALELEAPGRAALEAQARSGGHGGPH